MPARRAAAVTRRRLLAGAAAALALPTLARAQGGPRTVVDDAGRQVTLPAKVERVFAAGPPAAIMLYTLAPDLLLGWTSPMRPAERPYIAERYVDLPAVGRLTGRGNTANLEVVLSLKPDLVFDYGTINPTYVSLADRVQQQTGIPYLLIDGRFDAIADAYRRIGAAIGREADGAALAADTTARLVDVDRRIAAVPASRRPRVYYARGPNGLQTARPGSINVETLERMAIANVAEPLGPGGLVAVSLEQVLAWDPPAIVTVDPNFRAVVERDAAWSGVAAVRNRRVHLTPTLPFGWVDFPPAVNRLIGLPWLGRLFHPELFPEDIRSAARTFYARYYHRSPDEAALDRLLAGERPA